MKLFTREIRIERPLVETEAILKSENSRIKNAVFENGSFTLYCPRRTGHTLHTVKVTGNLTEIGGKCHISLCACPNPTFLLLVLFCSVFSVLGLFSLLFSTEGWTVKVSLAAGCVILILCFIGEYSSVLDLLTHKLQAPTTKND